MLRQMDAGKLASRVQISKWSIVRMRNGFAPLSEKLLDGLGFEAVTVYRRKTT